MNITNDKVTDFINSYYKAIDKEMQSFRLESERANIPIILKETEVFLRSFLLANRPKRILEIGSATGYSATFFAKLLPEASIETIEASQERYEIASKNFELFGVHTRVKIHLGKAEDILFTLQNSGRGNFDFVFIDAAKSHYKSFFEACIPLCESGAVVISDNVLMRAMTVSDEYDTKNRYKSNIKNLRAYVDFLMGEKEHYTSILSVGDGLAFTILNNNK